MNAYAYAVTQAAIVAHLTAELMVVETRKQHVLPTSADLATIFTARMRAERAAWMAIETR